jgi:hypothetical protein
MQATGVLPLQTCRETSMHGQISFSLGKATTGHSVKMQVIFIDGLFSTGVLTKVKQLVPRVASEPVFYETFQRYALHREMSTMAV